MRFYAKFYQYILKKFTFSINHPNLTMSEQSQLHSTLKLTIIERISIENAIKLALAENYDPQFYYTYKKQLPHEIFLIQISYNNQQWILLKTDKECQDLIQTVISSQLSPQKIVKKIEDAFMNIIPFSKNNKTQTTQIILKIVQISQRKNILENKDFTDFIEYTNVFQRYIYRKFTMIKKNGGRYKENCCKLGSIFSQWKKRQVNVQYNGITYKNEFGEMKEYLPFSHGFQYFFGKNQTQSKLGIVLISNHRRLILEAMSLKDYILFLYLLRKKTAESPYININRFNSFAPVRKNIHSQFYIDGKQYFDALSGALQKAKKSIFITGWMLSPQFLLERKPKKLSLFDLIADRVKQGVQVNIFIYHESSFLTNDSLYAKQKFQSLGSKVKVLRHPTGKLPVLWSHHSKMVIIDKQQAFFGGLDLCYGRYDCNNHHIFIDNDNVKQLYPGIEYNNCRLKDIDNVREYTVDHIDKRQPRLPWHDICQSVTGQIVSDFVHHFVEIWNFASYENRQVLNKVILNSPTQQQLKTIHNFISTKQTEVDIVNDIKIKKTNNIFNVLTNKIEQVKAMSRESITVLRSKLYPEKRKKLQQLYRKSRSPADINQFQNYIATLKKQIQMQQNNHNFNKRKVTIMEQKQNVNQNENQFQQQKQQQQNKNKNNKQNRKKSNKKIQFAKQPSIELNVHNTNKQTNQSNKTHKENNKNVIFDFLQKLQIKGNDIKIEIDEDIDSDEEAPAKIWENKPYENFQEEGGIDQCQLLRSVGNWSIGCSQQKTQFSIHLAYLQLISQAKHFIYIENQFFISSTSQTKIVKNQICNALYRRIKSAVEKKQNFKVYVMLPLLPAFAGNLEENDCTMLRMIMDWHYKTIKGLLENIKNLNVNPHNYIQFLGLRTHGINSQGQPATEIIYVHSKLMVVDDSIVLCGSANINDRSLLGDRDSQIAAVTYGKDYIEVQMQGKTVTVSQKIRMFRKRLWKEHFQLDDEMLDDPISQNLWEKVRYLSQKNTKIYRRLFGCYPDNQMKTLSQLKTLKQNAVIKSYIEETNQINGNVVEYPYNFLSNEPIQSSVVSKQYYIPTECLI